MSTEVEHVARLVRNETGLDVESRRGIDAEGHAWYQIVPRGVTEEYAFAVVAKRGWRRLRIELEPGKFAKPLLVEMGNADAQGREAFRAIFQDCEQNGAEVRFVINDRRVRVDSDEAWSTPWKRVELALNKGGLQFGTEESEAESDIVSRWLLSFVSAVVAVLPLEEPEVGEDEGIAGFPEGRVAEVQVNRYERDRRNRAAALAIHGTACRACGLEMGKRYGDVVAGFIEVHHVVPVSRIGSDDKVNPAKDLVPLCPNCHAVAHRREPPYSAEEIGQMLRDSGGLAD